MKNICIFNGNMSRGGGTERMAQILANVLSSEKDICIYVLSLAPCDSSYFKLNRNVILKSLPLRTSKLGMINTLFDLIKLLKILKIEIIINVDVFLAIYTIPSKLFIQKLKVISWEMFSIRNNIGLKWCRQLRQFALKFSDYYVCLTKGDESAFKNEYKVKCPISYVYNPYTDSLDYNDYKIDSKLIVTAGNFFYTKGFDIAVDVANLFLHKYKDWKWLFWGDGIEMETIQRQVHKYGLDKQVIFAGRTNQLTDKLKCCSIYVMTSRSEGFGLVLLEAKGCNLPTIAFDVPYGPAEIIEHDVSGYLIQSFDLKKMAESIEDLIQNEAKRLRFAKNAKRNMEKFDIQSFRNHWLDILSQLN